MLNNGARLEKKRKDYLFLYSFSLYYGTALKNKHGLYSTVLQ